LSLTDNQMSAVVIYLFLFLMIFLELKSQEELAWWQKAFFVILAPLSFCLMIYCFIRYEHFDFWRKSAYQKPRSL